MRARKVGQPRKQKTKNFFAKKLFWNVDEMIGKMGLVLTTQEILAKTKSKFEVRGLSDKTYEILQNSPIILVANHEFEAEVVALPASLPDRNDVYFIGTVDMNSIGENFAKHMIPVYVRTPLKEVKNMKLSSKMGTALGLRAKLPDKEAHEFNMRSMQTAVEKIFEGSLIIIFPQSTRCDGSWYSGVGYLMRDTKEKEGCYLAKAHIEGLSNLDVFRLIPGIRKLLPTIKVTFDEPKLITHYTDKEPDPKKIVKILQSEYEGWVSTLEN